MVAFACLVMLISQSVISKGHNPEVVRPVLDSAAHRSQTHWVCCFLHQHSLVPRPHCITNKKNCNTAS